MTNKPSLKHEFGGEWTTEKLERVRKYLTAYTRIFTSNPRARKLYTCYVDAFAGTGYRTVPKRKGASTIPFLGPVDPEAQNFLKGSARIALEVEPPFNRYVLIEQDPERARELETLREQFPTRIDRIDIVDEEANAYLRQWCDRTDWRQWRSVVFLDPYGMQVEWLLIETLAKTQAVDLWILFPLGMAVNRLLTRDEPPPEQWAQALTRMFGTDQWKEAFYPRRTRLTLFGEEETHAKEADFDRIGQFFVQRLKTVFTAVAKNPLALRNSKNTPLYLLCFASANPRGAPTAIKIAQDILRR
ncbi:MAG: three-Cys-motif partner protein TcmP [Chloroflexi bacterium]|nr:three-Cys-motif partner protein TcmP [Chloroflexota bacterium]